MKSAMDARQVVQGFVSARFAAEPDRARVAGYLTDDFEYVVPRSFGAPLRGAAALDALSGLNNALFDPDSVRYMEKRVLSSGDVVVVEHSVTATTMAGGRYENDFCWLYELRGGKIARAVQYADTLQARRGLGQAQEKVFGEFSADTGEHAIAGLDGVLACTTAICAIDGARGELRYRGYEIRDLVGYARFADVAPLLWLGRWPSSAEREHFDVESRARLALPAATRALLDTLPDTADPLAVLRTAMSIEGALDGAAEDRSAEQVHDKAITAYARSATLVGVLACRARGQAPRAPRGDLDRGANLLWMATGAEPTPLEVDALDALLITYAEHELNPSTFTGRIVAGTRSDYWSALTAAVGAFKGPLHGGIFGGAVKILLELGAPAAVPAYLDSLPAKDAYVPGFGQHHVYRTADPRVAGMARCAEQLAAASGREQLLDTARALERGLAERANSAPSADLYGGLVMHLLGFPPQLLPSLLAAGRFAGWTAHILEQYGDPTVIRPRAAYVGPQPRVLARSGTVDLGH